MNTRIIFTLFIFLSSAFVATGQTDDYYMSTVRAPMFQANEINELGFGVINRAMDFSYARQINDVTLCLAFQPKFNETSGLPLPNNTGLTPLYPVYATMAYTELYVSNRTKTKGVSSQWVGGGIAYQTYQQKVRLFGQLDWSAQNYLINAGFSTRASLYDDGNGGMVRLEPAITGKVKSGPLRFLAQLGYSIPISSERQPMNLLVTFSLHFNFGKTEQSNKKHLR